MSKLVAYALHSQLLSVGALSMARLASPASPRAFQIVVTITRCFSILPSLLVGLCFSCWGLTVALPRKASSVQMGMQVTIAPMKQDASVPRTISVLVRCLGTSVPDTTWYISKRYSKQE